MTTQAGECPGSVPVEPRLETCQNCDRHVAVGPGGKIAEHLILENAIGYWTNPRCGRSGHPSREELARREAKRAARKAALVDEMKPEAAPTLDALLGCGDQTTRSRLLSRLDDASRAALYEYNRANRTRHRHPYATEPGETEKMARRVLCRYCSTCLGSLALGTLSIPAQDHLTQCALEYLAGLRDPPR